MGCGKQNTILKTDHYHLVKVTSLLFKEELLVPSELKTRRRMAMLTRDQQLVLFFDIIIQLRFR